MTIWGLDSANPPNLASAKAVGVAAISRYLKKNLPNAFELGAQERLNILDGGFGLMYNPEQSANDLSTQPTSYFHDYGQEVAALLSSWGAPTWVNTPVSADTQVTSSTIAKAMNNYAAFASAVQPFGMIGYAQISVLNLLVSEGISRPGAKHWLPGSIGWSGYPNTAAGWAQYIQYPYAGMVQLGPQAISFFNAPTVAGCDTNIILDPINTGFEWPTSSPYYPKPAEDDDMDKMIIAIDPTTNGGAGGVYLLYSSGVLTSIEVDSDRVAFEASPGPAIPQAIVSLATWNNMNAVSNQILAGSSPVDLDALAVKVAPLVTIPAGPSLADITGAFNDALTHLTITETTTGQVGVTS